MGCGPAASGRSPARSRGRVATPLAIRGFLLDPLAGKKKRAGGGLDPAPQGGLPSGLRKTPACCHTVCGGTSSSNMDRPQAHPQRHGAGSPGEIPDPGSLSHCGVPIRELSRVLGAVHCSGVSPSGKSHKTCCETDGQCKGWLTHASGDCWCRKQRWVVETGILH